MNQEAICPPPCEGWGGNGRSSTSRCSNGCLHNSPSSSRAQKRHPSALRSLILPEIFITRFLLAELSSVSKTARFRPWSSIVIHCWLVPPPCLFPASDSALPLVASSPWALFLSPASNSLNRLASCQSRGLLWLCHKSARKNRNHLSEPGPERGWGCKHMSLALALCPANAHWTT